MGKRKKKAGEEPQPPRLPKNALSRISLGDSFAEYDLLRENEQVFVTTNAFLAACDPSRNKCFFIGRRGTGKTALTIQLSRGVGETIQIYPEVFGPLDTAFDSSHFSESHQKPYKSVVSAFELTLQFELLYHLLDRGKLATDELPEFARQELKIGDNSDFDLRTVRFVDRILGHLEKGNDRSWLKDIKRPKLLAAALNDQGPNARSAYSLIIDRLDESWDGSLLNVRFLAALMHACGEFTTRVDCARSLLFLRENVFERVRQWDSEFARIETRVVGLSWTEEKLVEFVERRLQVPFNSRWSIGGETWGVFFERPDESRRLVFDFCQNRPRDVLTYVKFAIEAGASSNHDTIQIDDLMTARKRFSDSRLKDLGDEYDENYPRIQIVLDKFYGLGWKFTRRGIESLLQNLLVADDIKRHCASWFYANSATESFVGILFQIGFLGVTDSRGHCHYRSVGADTTHTPAISSATDFEVHPMYRDSLDLQNVVVSATPNDSHLGTKGVISELPEGLDLSSYIDRLTEVETELESLPKGHPGAYRFEEIVGELIRLCFFRALANVQAKSRTSSGHVVRDWIAANRAYGGFWELVRHKWGATQVIWECKNYDVLKSDDFHQMAYYTNDDVGRFGIVAFRGGIVPRYWKHLQDILKNKKVLVLLLGERDLKVFLRQARAGKVKESHIQDRYDYILREIG